MWKILYNKVKWDFSWSGKQYHLILSPSKEIVFLCSDIPTTLNIVETNISLDNTIYYKLIWLVIVYYAKLDARSFIF